MTETEVNILLVELKGAFPSGGMNSATPQVYARHLADVDATFARQAVDQIIRTRTEVTLPTVGEIRKLATELDPRAQKLEPGERPPVPPGCTKWVELSTAEDANGPYVEGEADDGNVYSFEGKLPVNKGSAVKLLSSLWEIETSSDD